MNHSFVLTIGDVKCAKCKRIEIDHTDKATCESCPNVGPCDLYPDFNGMLLCKECQDKEEAIRNSPEEQEKRVRLHNELLEKDKESPAFILNQKLKEAQEIDNAIQIKSDIFNAQTTSIKELKEIIDADASIPEAEKHFTLAKILADRLNGFKKAIFDLNIELVDRVNEQTAVQIYLNNLSNKLRVEQREAIKIADINYKPNPVKISKPRALPIKIKFDKAELVKYANESGLPVAVLQGVCVQKGMNPQQAAAHLKKVMAGLPE